MSTFGSLNHPDVRCAPVFIYGLAEPNSLLVRYIGKSSSPKDRLSNHLSRHASYRMRLWVRDLRSRGESPRLVILLRVVPGEDAAEYERKLISLYPAGQILNARGVFGRKKLDCRNKDDLAIVEPLAEEDAWLRRRLLRRAS